MEEILDFETHEKGFERMVPTRENLKKNIGESFVYVDSVDRHRGYFSPKFGVIHSLYRNRLFYDDGHSEVNIKRIRDFGIKKKIMAQQNTWIKTSEQLPKELKDNTGFDAASGKSQKVICYCDGIITSGEYHHNAKAWTLGGGLSGSNWVPDYWMEIPLFPTK